MPMLLVCAHACVMSSFTCKQWAQPVLDCDASSTAYQPHDITTACLLLPMQPQAYESDTQAPASTDDIVNTEPMGYPLGLGVGMSQDRTSPRSCASPQGPTLPPSRASPASHASRRSHASPGRCQRALAAASHQDGKSFSPGPASINNGQFVPYEGALSSTIYRLTCPDRVSLASQGAGPACSDRPSPQSEGMGDGGDCTEGSSLAYGTKRLSGSGKALTAISGGSPHMYPAAGADTGEEEAAMRLRRLAQLRTGNGGGAARGGDSVASVGVRSLAATPRKATACVGRYSGTTTPRGQYDSGGAETQGGQHSGAAEGRRMQAGHWPVRSNAMACDRRDRHFSMDVPRLRTRPAEPVHRGEGESLAVG